MTSNSIEDIEVSLEAQLEFLKGRSAYDVFGLWKGCGRTLVRDKYYELVKDTHPDRYGGNRSARIKALSQEIFLLVQKSYKQLMSLEREQTVLRPSSQRMRTLESLRSTFPGRDSQSDIEISEIGLGDMVSDVMESETISEHRHSDTIRDTARMDEDRRAKLTRLAQMSSKTKVAPKIIQQMAKKVEAKQASKAAATPSLSEQQRQQRLERLKARQASQPAPPPPRQPSSPAHVPSPNAALSNRRELKKPQVRVSESQASFNEGYRMFRNKNYINALPLLERAVEQDPENTLFRTFLAYSSYMSSRTEDTARQAEQDLREIIKAKNKQSLPNAHLFLGYVLQQNPRKRKDALRHLQVAGQLTPSDESIQRDIEHLERVIDQQKQREAEKQNDVGSVLGRFFKK